MRRTNLAFNQSYQRDRNIKGLIPLVLLIALVVDAALSTLFPKAFIGEQQVIVPHFLVYFILVFAFYLRHSYILLYSFLIGLVQDAYLTTVLGLYAIIYYLLTYFILKTRRYFPRNAIIHFMLFIVAISLIDFVVYYFYLRVGLVDMSVQTYILVRLGPTLIFNTAMAFFLYFPAKALLRWLGYNDHIIF
ncbi:rod shape-determining protein MreD [Facklamia hominis]|uniref:Rod shape-determining protein MreD n=1 Tax=Facklamia hominis TaxID=178214 RepID=A0AAJ1Q3V8_9LACT|nr:rod shape-determining protein MreD [Facklamia hominis]MDK7187162.1 rod shape-determining protein MreD [Facklamia hominis]